MPQYKLIRRANTERISNRLLESVQNRFNQTVNSLNWSAKAGFFEFHKDGFGKSQYIDEWFNWSKFDVDFWSMANHLFTVEIEWLGD